MTAARKLSELTEDEFRALIREELGRPAEPKRTERPSVVDREPPPEAYAKLAAIRRRRGRR
jgi:hypothetical protein